ncbi:hypothetical protein BU17DRAFT_87670 [Hysterangium stoloniferum]|nr:hypothetical protein BU17DRAFT_87670 [Hysterangium stoloniferum]
MQAAVDLPSEVWIHIASRGLGKKDISSLTRTNRHIRSSLISSVFMTLEFEGIKPILQSIEYEMPARVYIACLQRTQRRIQYLLESPHLTLHTRHIHIRNWAHFPISITQETVVSPSGSELKFGDVLLIWKSTYTALRSLVASFPKLRTLTFIESDLPVPHDDWLVHSDRSLLSYDPCSHASPWNSHSLTALQIDLSKDEGYRFHLPQDFIPSFQFERRFEKEHAYFLDISQQNAIRIQAAVADLRFWTTLSSLSLEPFYSVRHLIIRDMTNRRTDKSIMTVQHILANCLDIQTLELAESITPIVLSSTALPKLKCITAHYSSLVEILRHQCVETVRIATIRLYILDSSNLHKWGHADMVTRLDISRQFYLSQVDLESISAAFHNLTHLMIRSLKSVRKLLPTRGSENKGTPQEILATVLESVSILPKLQILHMFELWDKTEDTVPTLRSRGHSCLEEIQISYRYKWTWVSSTGWCSNPMDPLEIDASIHNNGH